MALNTFITIWLATLACLWPGHARPNYGKGLTVLISIDGFRADYLSLGNMPTLARLAKDGAVAEGLKPPFPSLTFPSHVSIVTGRPPDRHGIVHNAMRDPTIKDQRFTLSARAAVTDARWWREAIPVWVTAARAGKTSATMFWPGSEAEIGGIRPTFWEPYQEISSDARVERLLARLQRPDPADFATLYFSEVDIAGHIFGPRSPEVAASLARVDTALAAFLEGLTKLGVVANLIIVSDHGMADASTERVIDVHSDLSGFASARGLWADALGGFEVSAAEEKALLAALQKRPHMRCWRKSEIPATYAFGRHRRVPAIVCLADTGWRISFSETLRPISGLHGYDPDDPSMWGLFIAQGPRIRPARLPLIANLDVYPLLCRLLDILPEDNEASTALADTIVR